MHRTMWLVGFTIVLSLIVLGVGGCARTPTKSAEPTSSAPAVISPDAVIQEFLDAKTKHGTLTFTSGSQQEQDKIEYWFDGDRYRLTWFNEDGSVRIHMISPDGKKLYYCYVKEEVCAISYTLPEMHQWIFNGPPDWDLGKGVAEGDLTAYTYTAQKLWNIEGASQRFYLEDLVVYADDTRIVKTVARTQSDTPESPDDLATSTYAFDPPEIGADIPEDIFTLPYEIGEKP